jgi:hypothetical protein
VVRKSLILQDFSGATRAGIEIGAC